jgi:hypothetical protein
MSNTAFCNPKSSLVDASDRASVLIASQLEAAAGAVSPAYARLAHRAIALTYVAYKTPRARVHPVSRAFNVLALVLARHPRPRARPHRARDATAPRRDRVTLRPGPSPPRVLARVLARVRTRDARHRIDIARRRASIVARTSRLANARSMVGSKCRRARRDDRAEARGIHLKVHTGLSVRTVSILQLYN